MNTDATQDTLNGLVLEAELRTAVGYKRTEEHDVRARAGLYGSGTPFVVVAAADISAFRTDGKADGPRFFTVEAARAVLPRDYSPLTADGVTYDAPKRVPTTTVQAYTVEHVEAMRSALAELRQEAVETAAALKAQTAKRRKAWLSGEPGAYLTFDDVRLAEDVRDGVRGTPPPIVGRSTLGREYPESAVAPSVRGDSTEVFDANRGRWVSEVN